MPPVRVSHIMTAKVVTFFEEQTLPLAEEVMENKRFRHLPVVATDGSLVGLVTRTDIDRAQISALVGLNERERRARQSDVQVRQLMSRGILTVGPRTLASEAAQLLLDHRIGCLPVVDEFGILRGIVTERDFLRFAHKMLAMHDADEGHDDGDVGHEVLTSQL
jgi:CBS domain-containing protein